jgi:hypothetical protein
MRFPTIVLAAGALVLLVAVFIGQRMGDRVMQQATEMQLQSATPTALPSVQDTGPQPYGPDWKRSQALSAAGDPRFPDPRVPPQPLPTAPPPPKPVATPAPTPTINPNIPIWRQKPLPTFGPTAEPSAAAPETPQPGGSPAANSSEPP